MWGVGVRVRGKILKKEHCGYLNRMRPMRDRGRKETKANRPCDYSSILAFSSALSYDI